MFAVIQIPFPAIVSPGITIEASKTFTGSADGGDSVSLTDLGTTLEEGDYILIALVTGDLTIDLTASMGITGYSDLAAGVYRSDVNDTNLRTFYKKMGATPDSSFTLPALAGSNFCGAVFAVRGANATTFLDVASFNTSGVNSDLADPGAITPITAGSMIFGIYAAAQSVSTAWTAPSNMSGFIQEANGKGRVGIGYTMWSGSGSFNPDPVTGGDSANALANSFAVTTAAVRRA